MKGFHKCDYTDVLRFIDHPRSILTKNIRRNPLTSERIELTYARSINLPMFSEKDVAFRKRILLETRTIHLKLHLMKFNVSLNYLFILF